MANLTTKTEKSFLQSVNDNLQVNVIKSTEEMQNSAQVAFKCVQKLNEFLESSIIPVGINAETAEVIYSPLNPQSIKQIADANNVAMSTLRKIRGLDKDDTTTTTNSSLDSVLKAAYNKIVIQQNNTYIQNGQQPEPKIISDDLI